MLQPDIILEGWLSRRQPSDGTFLLHFSRLAHQGTGHLDSHPLRIALPHSWMNQSGDLRPRSSLGD